MHKALETILVKRYPTIFKKVGGDPKETCMHWGIAVGKGWFKIIADLCKSFLKFGDEVVAEQVKEKFGGLRFYINPVQKEHEKEIYELIAKAEELSINTCETCGEPGEQRGKGWVRTLCYKCEQKGEFISGVLDSSCTYKITDNHITLKNPDGFPVYILSFEQFIDRFSQRLGFINEDEVEKFKNENVDGESKNSM
jgi:hypothetical protein